VVIVLLKTVRIVPQAFVGVVERLGRYSRTLPAGLHILLPFLDHLRPFVDMREQVVTFPPQPVITEDNVTISIDVVIYYQITDAMRSTYEVANLVHAMEQLSVTTLRNVIGSLSLEETLTSRDRINAELRIVMDDATEKWGVRVNRIELKSIHPPASIQEAMEKQMRAERSKRATVLEAEGEKQSQILRAEGDRQGAILRAEAQKAAQILEAEGDRQGAILRADGESQAIQTVFAAIHAGDRRATCSRSSTSRRCRCSPRARRARSSSSRATSPPRLERSPRRVPRSSRAVRSRRRHLRRRPSRDGLESRYP
jgi:regulator of protease activity HflC (stomatin/prohibitin superfamily)